MRCWRARSTLRRHQHVGGGVRRTQPKQREWFLVLVRDMRIHSACPSPCPRSTADRHWTSKARLAKTSTNGTDQTADRYPQRDQRKPQQKATTDRPTSKAPSAKTSAKGNHSTADRHRQRRRRNLDKKVTTDRPTLRAQPADTSITRDDRKAKLRTTPPLPSAPFCRTPFSISASRSLIAES